MNQPFPPPDFVAIESAIPGIEVYRPAPNVEPQREVVAFKCPRCGGNTAYSIADGGLDCTPTVASTNRRPSLRSANERRGSSSLSK